MNRINTAKALFYGVAFVIFLAYIMQAIKG